MTIGIYRLYNKVTNLSYVGKSKNIEARIKAHFRMLRQNVKTGSYEWMLEDYKKHGKDSFDYEILEECPFDQLDDREGYWAFKFDVFNPEKGYNVDRFHMPSYDKHKHTAMTPEEKRKKDEHLTYYGYQLVTENPANPFSLSGYFRNNKDGNLHFDILTLIRIMDEQLKLNSHNSPINVDEIDNLIPIIEQYQMLKSKMEEIQVLYNKQLDKIVGISPETRELKEKQAQERLEKFWENPFGWEKSS
jgi:group I intron endonuclease